MADFGSNSGASDGLNGLVNADTSQQDVSDGTAARLIKVRFGPVCRLKSDIF
jgi:hypothetical protein